MVAASGDESYVDDDGSSGSSSSSSSGGGSSGDAPVNDDAVPVAVTDVPPAAVASRTRARCKTRGRQHKD